MLKQKEIEEFPVPLEVSRVTQRLKKAGFKAYLVGGCTRDLIRSHEPKDWDIATNAVPEEILNTFPNESFYENKFGTVGVLNNNPVEKSDQTGVDESLKVVEVTTFRLEGQYSDKRRPDNVTFSKTIEDDLKRRDFTINSIAIDIDTEPVKDNTYKGYIIDPFDGLKDIKDKIIRTVGKPHDRFSEDALRMLRAIRLVSELDFEIDKDTIEGIRIYSNLLKEIASERIRDEFSRILMSDNPSKGLILSHKLGIIQYISKDLNETVNVEQNKAHKYDVWNHLLCAVEHSAKKKLSPEVRLAVLFHDIGKPACRRWSKEKKDWTFHGHDVVGERITIKNLQNLKFPAKTIDIVSKLVRWHMFFSDTEQITLSAVRRLVSNVGKENIWDLMDVRMCDRIGTGRPKENPYRLRKYKSMIEQVMTDPISVSMLKINGSKVMEVGKLSPGPKIGHILHTLLEEVIEDPLKNNEEYLTKRTIGLSSFDEKELKKLGEKAKESKQKVEDKVIKEIRDKYFVE